MSKLYDKLAEERDKRRSIPKDYKYSTILNVFMQLIDTAFRNTKNPDELPDIFILHRIDLTKREMSELLKGIGLAANVRITDSTYPAGYTFEIELIG